MLVLLGTFVSRHKLSASCLIPVRALRFKLDPGTHTLILVHALRFKLDPDVKAVRSNAGLGQIRSDPATSCALQA